MSYCDIEPQFYTEKLVTARKPHKCCETRREIAKGEKYWRITAKWDGDVQSLCQSEAAYHFARFLNGYTEDGQRKPGTYWDDCIPFGEIGEHVREMDDPDTNAEWERVKRGEITRNTTKGT